jgi:hypothetical protein
VKSALALTFVTLFVFGCADSRSKPEDAAKTFLRAIRKQDCKTVWNLFSAASQEQIRKQSEQEIKNYPSYAHEFAPEDFYCKSIFANRFLSYDVGSPKLKSIDGTNAVVMATEKEGTNHLVPGFFPTKFKHDPVQMNLVKENGAWKIDLVTPTAPESAASAARQKALDREKAAYDEAMRLRAPIIARMTNSVDRSAIKTNAP